MSPALLATSAVALRARAIGGFPALGIVVQDLYSAGSGETGRYSSGVTRALSMIEGATLRKADGVVVIHERFRQTVADRLRLPAERVSVIRNWSHVSARGREGRARVRSQHGWADDEIVVVHSGAMGEKQGLLSVVEAARLADHRGVRVRFVLVGDGGQREELSSAGASVRRLDFLPPVPEADYMDLLAAADLLLVNELPLVSNMAVPSKLTSYFTSGSAVLAATNASSTTADEIRSSGAGLVVLPGNPEELLDAALSLGSDIARRSEMGRNGMAFCADVLSESGALDAYADWAGRLIDERKRKAGQ